jgi:hypothetical protein
MAEEAPEQPQMATEPPAALLQYCITGSQYVKGGEIREVRVVKYPHAYIDDAGEREITTAIFKEWWRLTRWRQENLEARLIWHSPGRTGEVWTQFGEAAEFTTGNPKVFCYRCGNILVHPNSKRTVGTSHLTHHRGTKACSSTADPVHNNPSLPYIPRIRPSSLPNAVPPFSASNLEKELVRVVIDNNWSFRTIDRPSFQRFIQFLRPDAVITSRYKFGLMFHHQCELAKATLLKDLDSRTKVSIALDAWSAANHLSFLAVKGYYINTNWKLQEKLLNFVPMRGKHTGVSMATDVLQVLSDTNLKHRLLGVTSDNASNNRTMNNALKAQLDTEDISWSADENTIPCLAHVINLVVQDIIQHLKFEATTDIDNAEVLQRRHVSDIDAHVSVPNSLRKVRTLLSHLLITY